MRICVALLGLLLSFGTIRGQTPNSPLLFDNPDDIRRRAELPALAPTARRAIDRADRLLQAPPIVPSITKRGEPDPPGEQKGIASARALQGRVLTHAMAFTLTGNRKYRDAAVDELQRAIDRWRIWVDTAHRPPYDLMTGEICMTFGLAYDWLRADLTPDERKALRTGVERRALQPYLESAGSPKPPGFFTARHNWNPVTNGGAAVLALALEGESDLSAGVLKIAVPAMDHYWKHLADDGGWDEGTGYWTYGHRYAFIAAEALRRRGRAGGAERFALKGARSTGYFPLVFNPGRSLTAGFGDSNSRVNDPILHLLGREYRNADFIWFQDRAVPRPLDREGWPEEALTLVWRPAGEAWLPEARPDFRPKIDPTFVFPSIGWGFMASRQPDPEYFLSFKNGSLAANHTHLDLNHVSVGIGDTMMLVELGSRPYPADYFGPARYSYYEITTAGHNTVLIGGKGQVHGKPGQLLGPISGRNFEAVIGIADGAYERPATRARRHAVFVDRRYWVLLDEIETPEPQPVELRFHTYGTIAQEARQAWRIESGGRTLDIGFLSPNLSSGVEEPAGWTRPVKALSVKTLAPEREHALVTVIQPHDGTAPARTPVRSVRSARDLTVFVGRDRVRFEKDPDGWRIVRYTAPSRKVM